MARVRLTLATAALLGVAATAACSSVVDETPAGRGDPAAAWEKDFLRGWKLYQENLYDSAERRFESALIAGGAFDPSDPRILDTRVAVALVYTAQRRYPEAEAELLSVLPVERRISGDVSERVARIVNNLGVLYLEMGRSRDAEVALYDALRIRTALRGERDPVTAQTLQNLASAIRDQGRYDAALPMYEHAFGVYAESGDAWTASAAAVQNNIGLLYRRKGDEEKAETAHLAAIRLTRRVNATRNPNLAVYSRDLADLYAAQGRFREAEVRYRFAVEVFEKTLGRSSPQVRETLLAYGAMLAAAGREKEARALRARAAAIAPVAPTAPTAPTAR